MKKILFSLCLVGQMAHAQISIFPATQSEVDAGVVTKKYVSPKTLHDWSGGGGGSGAGPFNANQFSATGGTTNLKSGLLVTNVTVSGTLTGTNTAAANSIHLEWNGTFLRITNAGIAGANFTDVGTTGFTNSGYTTNWGAMGVGGILDAVRYIVDADGSASLAAIGRGRSGMYFSGTNGPMFITIGGTYQGSYQSGIASWLQAGKVGFESGGAGSSLDTYFNRFAAGVFGFNDRVSITNGIIGVVGNSSASTGIIGEFIESVVSSSSAVSLTTSTAANVTSISLTAGDWDVEGNITYLEGSGTVVQGGAASISTTSATVDITASSGREVAVGPVGASLSTFGLTLPRRRISIAGTTVVYLETVMSYSVGPSLICWGQINARRVR